MNNLKIDYFQWAECLLEEIYYTPDHQRVELIKHHLEMAHQRGHRAGYTEGVNIGWAMEQDEALKYQEKLARGKIKTLDELTEQAQKDGFYDKCEPAPGGVAYLSNPPQYKCVKCGVFYHG